MNKISVKHYIVYFLLTVCSLIIASSAHGRTGAGKVMVYKRNQITPVVIADGSAGKVVKKALNDLQYYLAGMTGKEIAVTNKISANRFPVYIGDVKENRYLEEICPAAKPGIDGFVLDVTTGGIHICAKTEQGVAYGVYRLLERMGVRWLFPGKYGEFVPDFKEKIYLTLKRTVDKPLFSIREVDSAWASGLPEWTARNYNNFPGFGGHSSLGMWKHRKEHPEWFAEINGVRQTDNREFKLCHSNTQMVNQAIVNVLKSLDKMNEEGKLKERFIYSISPTDGGGFCKCEECLKRGTVSDNVQLFVNSVAEAVAKKYPDIFLGYYGAYSEHYMPPSVKAHDNVIVFMTTWSKNLTKSLLDSENQDFRKKVEDFSKTCPHMAIRDYEFLDCWWVKGPYSLVDVHSVDYKWYYEHGIIGILTECSDYWEGGAQSNYIMARLWWNPYADVEEIKKDYVRHAYGRAFVPMWRFHERINKERAFIEESVIIKLRHDLEEAAKLAQREDVKTRIKLLRLHYLQLHACSELEMGRATDDLLRTAFRASLTYLDGWGATVTKRIVMPQIYHGLQQIPGNGRMKGIKYPYTISEKVILQTVAEAGLTPYTEDEVEKVLATMKIPDAGTSLKQWSTGDDLKLEPLSKNNCEYSENIRVHFRYLYHKLLIYVENNEVIDIAPAKGTKSLIRYKLVSPENLQVSDGEFSVKKPLRFTANSRGIYTLDIQAIGGWPSVRVKNRYVVLKASSAQQAMHPMGGLKKCYFYVPAGTKEFAFILKGDKGEPYEFVIWDSLDSDAAPLIPKKLYKNTSFVEHRINVPAGSDGKVWKLWLSGEDMEMFIKGIPPFISNDPCRLLKSRL